MARELHRLGVEALRGEVLGPFPGARVEQRKRKTNRAVKGLSTPSWEDQHLNPHGSMLMSLIDSEDPSEGAVEGLSTATVVKS